MNVAVDLNLLGRLLIALVWLLCGIYGTLFPEKIKERSERGWRPPGIAIYRMPIWFYRGLSIFCLVGSAFMFYFWFVSN